MAAHEQDQSATQIEGEQGHSDGGDEAPNDECVPLPLPDFVKEAQGMMAEMLDLMAAERELAGVEEVHANFNEWNEEQQVQRRDDVQADLRGDLIEAEDPGDHGDREGGDSNGGVDADDETERDAPGHAPGGNAAAQLTEQRAEDLAAEEFADGLGDQHGGLDAGWVGVG